MKLLLHTIFILMFPLVSSGQLLIDYAVENEIAEIILNCQKNNVKEFTIRYSEYFNNRRSVKDKFVYRFLNDSTLRHKYEKYTADFLVKDNKVTEILTKEDSLGIDAYLNQFIYKTVDSIGIPFNYVYVLTENDTVPSAINYYSETTP